MRPPQLLGRVLNLYRMYTVLDATLVARALGVNRDAASRVLSHLRRTHRLTRHRARNARRTRVYTAYTLPGGTPHSPSRPLEVLPC